MTARLRPVDIPENLAWGKHPTANPHPTAHGFLAYNYAAMEANRTSRATESAGTNPPRRILVADDDISIRQLSSEVLIHFGYGVDTAAGLLL
jgi:hypothetical protein